MSFSDRGAVRASAISARSKNFRISLLALVVQAAIMPLAGYAADNTTVSTTNAPDTATSNNAAKAKAKPASASKAADSSGNNPSELVVTAAPGNSPGTAKKTDYTVQTTRAGTKLLMTPRDIPQSFSVITQARMKDQDLQSVGDVLANTTGITQNMDDSERSEYYSRGFKISSFTYDGIPTSVNDPWNFGDAASDTAIYDRIEVVRGATGLMTGAGNPAASVNMVRKQADSKTPQGSITASYGSWNNQRYVADVQSPLNESGTLRGRIVTGYQDQDSWLDRYHKTSKFFYGVLNADLGDNTTASLAYDYHDSQTGNPTWGGLPDFYSNGNSTHYRRSLNSAADWTRYNTNSHKILLDLVHNFDNGWVFKINGTHAISTFNDKLLDLMTDPDEDTGEGVTGWGSLDRGRRELNSVDTYASGPFSLFGREHQLMAGVSYSRQHNATYSQDGITDLVDYDISSDFIGAFNNHWNGHIPEPEWQGWYLNADDVVRQKSAYTAARFSLADPLSLIVGARYTQWSTVGSSGDMSKNNITPYAGLVYDINDTLSAYASYTSIFLPQSYRTSAGQYLKPVTGRSYETGLKSDWLNGRLTATLAVFRIEQENAGQQENGVFVNNSSEQAYIATKGAVSKGVEFELNGAVTDNLEMTFGATRYVATDSSGRFNPEEPQTSFKLFARYNVPQLPALTVGGGFNWQNRIFDDVSGADGNTVRVYQSSYPLASLFARYQVTRQVSVQANVNNLFDRSYYSYLNNYVYGAPRNFSVSLSYQF